MARTVVSILPPLRELVPDFSRYHNAFSDLTNILNNLLDGELSLDYMLPLEECVGVLTLEFIKNEINEVELDGEYVYDQLKSIIDYEIQLAAYASGTDPDRSLLDEISIDLTDEMISIYFQFFDKITKSYSLWSKLDRSDYRGITIHDHEHLTAVVFSRTL